MTQKDDFFSQVLDAESEAQNIKDRASKKGESDLTKIRKHAEESQRKELDMAREKAKERVSAQQKSARKKYDALVAEGSVAVQDLEARVRPQIKTTVIKAQEYLIKDLLGA
jgi:flagellar biosynthesis/type III secretory pathway protein FliH